LSSRQAKKRRIRTRKLRELRWLSENPNVFELNTGGLITHVELHDFGYQLGVTVQNDAGGRFGMLFGINALSKRVDKYMVARIAAGKLLAAAGCRTKESQNGYQPR